MALLVSVLALVWVIMGVLLLNARSLELKRASTEASNISAAVSQDLARNIEIYDLSIQGVIEGLAKPVVMATTPELRQLILFDRAATARHLGAIFVLDPAGNIVFDSASVTPRVQNYADRDYFKAQLERADAGLYIGRPVVSRTDGQLIIGLSRRITRPDGSFGGIVLGTIHLEYIHNLFARMKLGNDGSMTLFRTDGTVMMREPYDPAQLGMIVKLPILLSHFKIHSSGEFQAKSVLDGIERLIHYDRVGDLPLIQVVNLSIEDIYADWWQRVLTISSLLLVCCAIIGALAVAFRRELMLRTRAEASLLVRAEEDGLTGIANRRRFDESLDFEWAVATRHQTPLSLLMLDADHFKLFNDRFGHLAGDRALVALGGVLKARTRRPGDLAARYGGEEFAVILPRTNGVAAMEVAEAIRRDVSALRPSAADPEAGFSISIGVGSMTPRPGIAVTELIAEADAALYASKKNGRSRSTLQPSRFRDRAA